MENIRNLRGIKPQYNKSLILTRLGYKRGATEISSDLNSELDHIIKETEDLCPVSTAYRLVRIREHRSGIVELEDGTVLSGGALSKLLAESNEVVLMASTAGSAVMDRIRALFDGGRAGDAVVMDAAASEIADAGLDFLMDYIATFLRREGKTLTKHRFSPGYGDFTLDQQAHFARLLEIGKMGIAITETCMLIPEKSVLAVAGIVSMSDN